MKKLIIFLNKKKPESKNLASAILPILEKGFACTVTDNTDEAAALISAGADAAICLGGDGTILSVASAAAESDTPILGINLGHLGYMSELEANEISMLENLCDGNYGIEKRFMLSAKLIHGDGTAEEYGALNEILVCRGAVSKMIRLALRCNGTDVAAYRADGLIVSTPTGSTAYALSAGGPIIDPALSLISVCPICPHTFAGARPLVFSPDSGLEITVSSLYNGDIYLTADGKASRSVNYDDVITVTGSERSVRFIKLKSNAFYQTLYKKFKAGV